MSKASKWVVYDLRYKMPIFGSETDFTKDDMCMLVCTKLGESDAVDCCERHHNGCKIVKQGPFASGMKGKWK